MLSNLGFGVELGLAVFPGLLDEEGYGLVAGLEAVGVLDAVEGFDNSGV